MGSWKSKWDALMAGDGVGGVRGCGREHIYYGGCHDVIQALAFKTNISDDRSTSS